MCNVSDVLQSSSQSANAMTSALCDYGGGDMGSGIRKMFTNGYRNGYCAGYDSGFFQGTIKTAVIFVTILGIKTAYNRYKLNQQQKQEKLEENEREISEC